MFQVLPSLRHEKSRCVGALIGQKHNMTVLTSGCVKGVPCLASVHNDLHEQWWHQQPNPGCASNVSIDVGRHLTTTHMQSAR